MNNIAKGIAKIHVIKLLFFGQKVKSQQQQNKKANIKTFARAGNRTLDLLHRSLERSPSATESTERIDCCQAI